MEIERGENSFLQNQDQQIANNLSAELEKEFNQFMSSLKRSNISEEEAFFYLEKLSEVLGLAVRKVDNSKWSTSHRTFVRQKPVRWQILTLIKKGIKILIGVLLIALGIAMIIIPAPFPAFEIATIYYFNPQDGITIMDLISLLIVFYGIHGIIEAFSKLK